MAGDLINGDDDNNTLNGTSGDDTINGLAGDDTIDGGPGADLLDGGDGRDKLSYASSTVAVSVNELTGRTSSAEGNDDFLNFENVEGSDFNDTIRWDSIGDVVGGAGDDSLRLEHEDDGAAAFGGLGNDTIFAAGGAIFVDGGDGDDVITANNGVNDDTLFGGTGNDTIRAFQGDNEVNGGDGDDSIVTSDGQDTIFGGAGDDYIVGGDGADEIDAGDGHDEINAGFGADTVWGGLGDDTITISSGPSGGTPENFVFAGEGNNVVNASNSQSAFTITAGSGDDQISVLGQGVAFVSAGDGNNDITTSGWEATIISGSGDDIIHSRSVQDSIESGAGNDQIIAGPGDSTIRAGDGDDRIETRTGDDTAYGGEGADTIIASGGANLILGEEGDDSLVGGSDDTIHGGLGDDFIDGGTGSELLTGGAGQDTIIAGGGDVRVDSGDDDDVIRLSAGAKEVLTGSGNDLVEFDARPPSNLVDFHGGLGDDTISFAESNLAVNFDLDGGHTTQVVSGFENLIGSERDDTLSGDDNDNSIDGGEDDDIITGDGGDDTLTGGQGADVFVLDDDFGNDIVTDFGLGTDLFGTDIHAKDVVVTDGGTTTEFPGGSQIIEVPDGSTIRLAAGTVRTDSEFSQFSDLVTAGFVCFTKGTRIRMFGGTERSVEDIRVGDLVLTADNGAQPVRWVGMRTVAAVGKMTPVKILPGYLGNNRPLIVSPQHRMLVQDWRAELQFGEREVLVAAKDLVDGCTVVTQHQKQVTYAHILFDKHEVIWANGVRTESFHPGKYGMGTLGEQQREEVFSLFPRLQEDPEKGYGEAVRSMLKSWEGKLLASQLLGTNVSCDNSCLAS